MIIKVKFERLKLQLFCFVQKGILFFKYRRTMVLFIFVSWSLLGHSYTEINAAQTQTLIIKGIVSDASGIPLLGATVIEKGTTNGVQTDFDGKFSLTVTDSESLIVISYLGYITQEIKVSQTKYFEVILQEDIAQLHRIRT